MSSEIFDNYANIMKKEGFVVEADALDNYRESRIGSDDISAIEALYGVKPNNEKDKEHISERAHPDMAVVSPAYDAMNGVVETIQERHNMMVGIALKQPHGNLTQHRYVRAKKELLDELVRIGFTLDNKDEVELMKLADSCSERLVKESWIPLAIGATLAALSGALGIVALVNNAKPSDQGILNNLHQTFEQINEAKDEMPNLREEISFLEEKVLRPFEQYVMAFENLGNIDVDVLNPTDEDIKSLAQDPQKEERTKIVNNYLKACQAMIKILPRYIDIFNAASEKPDKEETYRWWAHISEFWQDYISPPESKDVALYLDTLKESCAKAIQNLKAIHNIVKKRALDLASAMEKQSPETSQPSVSPSLDKAIETSPGFETKEPLANV